MAGASSLTISGPPSTLKHLFETSPLLRRARRHPLHLTAAYHASHLDLCKIDEIIGVSPIIDRNIRPNTSVVSTSSGEMFGENYLVREVLYKSLVEILQLRIDWSLIVQRLTTFSKELEVTLSVIGPTNATGLVERALKPTLVCDMAGMTSTDDQFHRLDYGTPSEAIAIVGMSGRFPKGESLEEFWQVLENGLDLHKEVRHIRSDR